MRNERIVLILGFLLILIPKGYTEIEGARICPICSPPGGPYVYWDECPHGRGGGINLPPLPTPPQKKSLAFYQKEGERLFSDVWEVSRPLTLRLERLYACKDHYEKAMKDYPNNQEFKKELSDINGYIRDLLDRINREKEKMIREQRELANASNRVNQLLINIQSFTDENWRGPDSTSRSFFGPDDESHRPSKLADRVRSQFMVDLRPRDNDIPLVIDPLVVAGEMKAPEARVFRAKQTKLAKQRYRTAFINGKLDKALDYLRFAISQTPCDSELRMEYMMARLLKQGKRVSGGPIERVQVLLDALEMNKNDWLKSCAYLRRLESTAKTEQEKREVKEAFRFVVGAAIEVMAIDDYRNFPSFISPMLDLPDDEDIALMFDDNSNTFGQSITDWLQADLDFEAEIMQQESDKAMAVLEKANELFYAKQDPFAAIEFLKQSLKKGWYKDNEEAIRMDIRLKEGIHFGREYLRETNRIKQYQSPPQSP